MHREWPQLTVPPANVSAGLSWEGSAFGRCGFREVRVESLPQH